MKIYAKAGTLACVVLLGAACEAKTTTTTPVPTPGIGPSGLSATEQATRFLDELNAECAMSSCEERYDYTFEKVACQGKECTVTFVAKSQSDGSTKPGQVTFQGYEDTDLIIREVTDPEAGDPQILFGIDDPVLHEVIQAVDAWAASD